MASNGGNSKRKRGNGSGDEETQEDKKLRLSNAGPSNSNQPRTVPLAISSQLVQSVNAEWSRTETTRRIRSNSLDSCKRKEAKMTVQLSSSNPEPTTFLMGVLATELGNIENMVSGVTQTSSPTSSTASTASMHSAQSSPDHYDQVVPRGNRVLDKLNGVSEYDIYNTYR